MAPRFHSGGEFRLVRKDYCCLIPFAPRSRHVLKWRMGGLFYYGSLDRSAWSRVFDWERPACCREKVETVRIEPRTSPSVTQAEVLATGGYGLSLP
jgi:hypothetical protein